MPERPTAVPERDFAALLEAYTGPERHYHGLAHIEAMLEGMQSCRHLLHDPEAIELAIWFHDAVYESSDKSNEENSAALAHEVLKAHLAPAPLARIRALILATKRHEMDERLGEDDRSDMTHFLDLDLQILGAPTDRFDAYEAAVRREYAHVEEPAWRIGRSAVLQRFAARARLCFSSFFAERLEEPARDNLARSLARLARDGASTLPSLPRSTSPAAGSAG